MRGRQEVPCFCLVGVAVWDTRIIRCINMYALLVVNGSRTTLEGSGRVQGGAGRRRRPTPKLTGRDENCLVYNTGFSTNVKNVLITVINLRLILAICPVENQYSIQCASGKFLGCVFEFRSISVGIRHS